MLRICLLLFCFPLWAQQVLIIGDSHTAGIFGKELHKSMTQHFSQVTTLGHASSAPLHWVDDSEHLLSGGVFNQLFYRNQTYTNPNPTHWLEKVKVPKLKAVLENNAYHASWKQSIGSEVKAETIIIALGANDARAISDSDGTPRPSTLNVRSKAIQEMLSLLGDRKCLWVGPPNGIKKPQANQAFLYKYLKKQVGQRCEFFSSNHIKVNVCDGIHFNCRAGRKMALLWVNEVTDFILQKL
jgi:hypothetical protein